MKNKNNYLRTNAKKQAYKNKGITLIALIITIVIMLILVAVSVNIIINSNIIGQAEKAAEGYKTAYEQEANGGEIEINGKKYGSVEEYLTGKEKLPEIEAGTRATEPSEYKSNNKTAVIPAGFTVSGISTEQSIDGGLVIYDIPEGTTVDWTNPDSVKTQYNQFVWIPVEVNKTTEPKDTETSIASFYRTAWANDLSTGGERTTGLGTNYTEPYSKGSSDYDGTGTGKTGISAQITELTKSIYKYGGFYIGRYEAGSETARTSGSSQTAAFVVQQDKYPYNYVSWGEDMGYVSEGAVHLSNSLYTGRIGYGVKSMLCTGAAWDSMLDFIKDSIHNVTSINSWGNYYYSDTFEITRGAYAVYDKSNNTLGSFNNVKSQYSKMKGTAVLLTTGATERNSSKNIYDVAGNCWEWTTEASYTNARVVRGGNYLNDGYNDPANNRQDYLPPACCDDLSFRPLLYVAL